MKQYIRLSPDSPIRALFVMDDDSMRPHILPGETLSLVFELPRDGQIGLFRLGRETLVRQFCLDSFGTVYLLAGDRSRPELDRVIPPGEDAVICLGRVLMDPDPPLPLA